MDQKPKLGPNVQKLIDAGALAAEKRGAPTSEAAERQLTQDDQLLVDCKIVIDKMMINVGQMAYDGLDHLNDTIIRLDQRTKGLRK